MVAVRSLYRCRHGAFVGKIIVGRRCALLDIRENTPEISRSKCCTVVSSMCKKGVTNMLIRINMRSRRWSKVGNRLLVFMCIKVYLLCRWWKL